MCGLLGNTLISYVRQNYIIAKPEALIGFVVVPGAWHQVRGDTALQARPNWSAMLSVVPSGTGLPLPNVLPPESPVRTKLGTLHGACVHARSAALPIAIATRHVPFLIAAVCK
jgi:hypothetical protein